jgi:gentisate 1,2-dioxygenase
MDVELSTATRQTLERHNLRPLWEVEEDALGHEREQLAADIWKWDDVETAIKELEADVDIADLPPGFRRRVAVPINVSYDGAISFTIYVGIQTVSPGEEAVTHRHGANALRFTIDGHEEMKTAVGGEEFPMLEHDLITTPQWEWHGHVNESDEEVAWLDVLDLPLVFDSLNLGPEFEEHGEGRQSFDKPMGYHASQYGGTRAKHDPGSNADVPGPYDGIRTPTPPYRFEWSEVAQSLDYAGDNEHAQDPYDGIAVEYVNPARGTGPLFPTFDVRAQRLPDGEATRAHSHNATEIYFVIEGAGQTSVGERTLDWGERDIFLVPPNEPHFHNPDDDATLLALSNRALLESINFYHEADEG